jgi:imidazole glycerol-phosphate synthase subunit HisH
MAVVLIDYGAGNLRSAAKALEAAGAPKVHVSADPAELAAADRIVLPGVGAFGACASALRAVPGLEQALNEAVIARRVPFLGICVGMQLMADEGHEFGVHKGLGWVRGAVKRMAPTDPMGKILKIPQIGWNEVLPRENMQDEASSLIRGGYAYFVHSYALQAAERCRYRRHRQLRRRHHRRRPARQHAGRAVPPREEPGLWPRTSRPLAEMAALMPFTIYPAIDLKGGEVVRLAEGDMARATVYARILPPRLPPLPKPARNGSTSSTWMERLPARPAMPGGGGDPEGDAGQGAGGRWHPHTGCDRSLVRPRGANG